MRGQQLAPAAVSARLGCASSSNHHSTFAVAPTAQIASREALRLRYKCVSVWNACAAAIAPAILFMPSGRLIANLDATCHRQASAFSSASVFRYECPVPPSRRSPNRHSEKPFDPRLSGEPGDSPGNLLPMVLVVRIVQQGQPNWKQASNISTRKRDSRRSRQCG